MSYKFPLSKIVEVHWNDANTRWGWADISVYETHHPMPVKSVGYLLKRTKKFITIVLSQSDQDDLNQAISIPVKWITKYRVLRK